MTVKRSGREARWAALRRRKRVGADPFPGELETALAELPQPAPTELPVEREWNIWDLERLARAEAPEHPEQRDEWAFLFVHLRQFANADGVLPTEFDSLVRESFGGLLERQPSR